MQAFKHYISLGYFCSPAMELERLGLRSQSYPFDWLLSDWGGLIELMGNGFSDFLNPELFCQDIDNYAYYKNTKYNIWFFHDFDKYHSVYAQLPAVKDKYKRRIDRFYHDIREPTLFIRYISGTKEVEKIEREYSDLMSNIVKRFNSDNDILFIANSGICSNTIKIYNCEKDLNDSVARHPFEKNIELKYYFENIPFEGRDDNIKRYEEKLKINNSKIRKIENKISEKMKEILLTEYCFDKQLKRD